MIRVMVYRVLAGNPLFVVGFSQYPSGVPKVLGPIVNQWITEGNVWGIRIALTVLQLSRIIPGWKKIDTMSITKPGIACHELQEEFKLFLVNVYKQPWVGMRIPTWGGFHPTTRIGPNGPALMSACLEFKLWADTFFTEVASPEFYPFWIEFVEHVTRMHKAYQSVTWRPRRSKELILRRLGTIDDKEGKLRVVGIIDYWTQSLMKPFHEFLLRVLGRIPQDLTFGQDIAPFGPSSQQYWSIDLTSATDRFPVLLQKIVMSQIFGQRFGELWHSLLTKVPFSYKGKLYKYSVGQPMGAYSSWAAFALTHHIFIQFTAYKVGLYPFRGYRVLGDDVVIRNDAVAKEYLRLLGVIGVEVSFTKTLTSPHTFEFAKRVFYKDTEVTPFPIASLCGTTRMVDIIGALWESIRRGYPDLFKINPNIVGDLLFSFRKGAWTDYKQFDSNFSRRIGSFAGIYWSLLTRFSDADLLADSLDLYSKSKTMNYSSDYLVLRFREFLSRGVIQHQMELIFRNGGCMQEVSPFSVGLTTYEELSLPVIIVLGDEYVKLTSNLQIFESNLDSQDFDAIIFQNKLSLELDPITICSEEKRVQARQVQSKSLRLGLSYMMKELPTSW